MDWSQIQFIKNKVSLFYERLEKELQTKTDGFKRYFDSYEKYLGGIGARSKTTILEFHPVVEKFEELLEESLKFILFEENEKSLATTVTVLVKEGARKVKKNLAVDLPHYFYPHSLRSEASKVMGHLKGRDPLFGYYAKKELKDTLTQK